MITLTKKLGNVAGASAPVKTYRAEPSNFHYAACAAAHYAKRNGRDMAIVAGNSYMHAVYHITDTNNIRSATVVGGTFTIGIAKPNGDIYQAVAEI